MVWHHDLQCLSLAKMQVLQADTPILRTIYLQLAGGRAVYLSSWENTEFMVTQNSLLVTYSPIKLSSLVCQTLLLAPQTRKKMFVNIEMSLICKTDDEENFNKLLL